MPNEVVYKFTPIQATDLTQLTTTEPHMPAKVKRIKATNSIAFAQISAKQVYDTKHKAIQMKVGESTKALRPKLLQQYTSLFQVVEQISQLAYQSKLPQNWQVHQVFTIAQLEPCLLPHSDFFNWKQPHRSEPVFVEEDTERVKSFVVKKIVVHG